jgi:hypothetical protein
MMGLRLRVVVAVLLVLACAVLARRGVSWAVEDTPWEVVDRITPTLDGVKWDEKGAREDPPAFIADGRWYDAHSRHILVQGEYVFVNLVDRINWALVNEGLGREGLPVHASFEDFRNSLLNDPAWWLMYAWGLEATWLGISVNATRIHVEYVEEGAPVTVITTCRVTNLPEYFGGFLSIPQSEIGVAGQKRPESLLAILDLSRVYYGDLVAMRFEEDYSPTGNSYFIYFEAPANLVSQYGQEYTFSLVFSPLFQQALCNAFRQINVTMPAESTVNLLSPEANATRRNNVGAFILHPGDAYPTGFVVQSGPPQKDFAQVLQESAAKWATDPGAWVAFGSVIVLLYTGFQGRRVWNRRKVYYRLYRSLVSLYDRSAADPAQREQEMKAMSRTITELFVVGKITDDQFDKLLTRLDDLAGRVQSPAT